ncbi:MAG TPA: lipid-A-disaccharide synthase [Burkholderiaceae bacterium]|nr:lipid-A-disaccharide synthase [Burkholderiaceae bacterium]
MPPNTEPGRIAMVAGEPSGDLLAGLLLGPLKQQWPNTQFWGIGGPRMQSHGFKSKWPMDALSVHGYWDALRNLHTILGIRRALRERVLAERPALFIGTDAPDFNLSLEADLRAAGIKTVHFVSPSIWAWRGERVNRIARSVDLMLCLFPFEPELYERAGVRAVYVGHPLADTIPLVPDTEAARKRLKLAPQGGRVVAVLPGSRMGEVQRIGPIFAETMRLMHSRERNLRFLVPTATPMLRTRIDAQLEPVRIAGANITVLDGRSHDAIEACDAVLVASGTATLECALFKKPMVIAYRAAWLSALLMRRMGYLPYVGLPNVLAREFVVPEFLQERAQPDMIADAMFDALNDEVWRRHLAARFDAMHRELKQGTGARAAEAINDLLANGEDA